MLKIDSIKTNYMTEPSGIIGSAQISWALSSDKRNVHQKSYRLRISKTGDFNDCVYDSGTVFSDESAHIRPELNLESITRYYIQVQVTDDLGETAQAQSSFITGYSHIDQWQGSFISVESPEDKDESFGTLLRREFVVSGKIKSAYFVGTAHGLYQAYLNGEKVGEDYFTPGWTSYNKRLQYQVYDVSHMVSSGRNTCGIMLGAGWYKGKMSYNLNRNHYGCCTAFGGQLVLDYEDGRREIVASDSSWKGARGPILFSEIYDGESYDARLAQEGWDKNGFDDSKWQHSREMAAPKQLLCPQQGKGVQIMHTFKPIALLNTPAGERVLDFGQNLSGWCRFTVKGAKPGDKVLLRFFETLDAQGNVYTENLRTAKQTITYICKGGQESYQPSFSYQGFRYAQVIQWPVALEKEDFTACVLHTAMEQTGEFTSSNPLLNQLQHNILWSMKGNSLDIPSDCPQRDERLGWTGDVQIFCSTALVLMNAYSFYSKWLKDVAADQTEDGAVAHIVPDIVSGKSDEDWLTKQGCSGASAWADVAVILPWNLYLSYGDRDIILQQYESMKSWIDFMGRHSSQTCLFEYKLQFGDWVALDAEEGSYFGATPTLFTSAAYYCLSTGLFAKMAEIVGREQDARQYQALYEKLCASFREHFISPEGELSVQTQTAHIIALQFGLVPQEHRAKVAARLAELLEEQDGHLVTGFVGTPYFCSALSENGYVEQAYELLLKEDFPSWLYQVKQGATTVWEHWDGLKPDGSMWSADMNSFNHYSYGSVGDWLYKSVCGLRPCPEQPGYRRFSIMPRLSRRLSKAGLSYDSLYGRICVSWQLCGDRAELELEVPANTGARLVLEDARQICSADGLEFTAADKGFSAQLGSGRYRIEFKI